jgi:hypothetical protein
MQFRFCVSPHRSQRSVRWSADAEQTLCFFHSARVAEELEGKSAVTLLQDDSKKPEVVTFQLMENLVFCLSNQILFKPAWLKTCLQPNHDERAEKAARSEPVAWAGNDLLGKKIGELTKFALI